MGEKTATHEYVRVGSMKIANYQRGLNESRVKKMLKDFDLLALGTIIVSQRKNGEFFIIDGQHRVEALLQQGQHDYNIMCNVLRGLSYEEEAEMFNKFNVHRGPPKATDRFNSQLEANNPEAKEIERIVKDCGYRLILKNHYNYDNEIRAVGALELVHRMGEGFLRETLGIIREIWGGDREVLQSQFIGGIATFIKKYQGEYERGRLIRKISEIPLDKLIREAKAITELDGSHSRVAIAKVLMKKYNHRATKNRLENKFLED